MPRPCKMRTVSFLPDGLSFKPCGRHKSDMEIINLNVDELEAIRLADLDGLYQDQAAERMKISRQTFGNIIMEAHKKVADFLIHSKHLIIEGGHVRCCGKKGNCRKTICNSKRRFS